MSSSANSGHLLSNDGSYVTSFGYLYCTLCQLVDNYVWWTIDFGIVYYIGEVFIVGRRDCCRDRMRNLIIRVGNSSSNDGLSNPQCVEEFSMTSRLASSAYCDPYGVGKYLTINKHDADPDMTLCEVAIFRLENGKTTIVWCVSLGPARTFEQTPPRVQFMNKPFQYGALKLMNFKNDIIVD